MRKKGLFYIIIAAALLFMALPGAALADAIQITVNGEPLTTDVAPVIRDYRTLVPMRAICEKLGAAVNFAAGDMSVTVIKGNTVIVLYLDSNRALINGTETALDVAPVVIEQRTMLPLRFLGETLGCVVNWLPESNLITVEAEPVEAAALADALLALVNTQRQALGLSALTRVQPLDNMAYLQARELSLSGALTHISATHGNLEQRSQQAGVINVSELLFKGGYDAQSIWNEWISMPEYRELLHGEDIYFCGIYACYAPANGADDLYVCLELIRGDGFFVDARAGFATAGALTLQGYVAAADTRLVLYALNPENPSLYLNRFSYYISPNADYSFSATLNLSAGLYAVCLGNDQLTLRIVVPSAPQS